MTEEWVKQVNNYIDALNINDAAKKLFKDMARTCKEQNDKINEYGTLIIRMDGIIEGLKMAGK